MCWPCLEVAPVTLFSLVKKNLIGNARSYLLYFVSLVLSVMIYFTFVSLMYSREIKATMELADSIRNVFFGASIVLILFVAVFIWFSNGFFTRRRKKEVGLYALLGIRKRTIGLLLFYENLLMGALALGAGVLLGTLLSKMFAMIFLKLLDSAVEVSFRFSGAAIVNTVIVFMALILLVSVRAYRLVYRFQLAQLFQADKEGEHAPRTSLVAALAAAALLAGSYWIVFQPMTSSEQMGRNGLLFLIGLIAGTYLLFRSGIMKLLQLAQRNKSRYYSGMNLVAVSQLAYRMKGNTRTLTMIALLSAMALSAVSTGYIMYTDNGRAAEESAPFSYSWVSRGELDAKAAALIEADKSHPVTAQAQIPVLRAVGDVSKLGYIPSAFPAAEMPMKVMSASAYTDAVSALGERSQLGELQHNEAAIIRPRYTSDLSSADLVGRTIDWRGKEAAAADPRTEVHVSQLLEEHVLRWGYPDLALVVSDETFAAMSKTSPPITYMAYNVENERKTGATAKTLLAMAEEDDEMSPFYTPYREGLENGGLNLFILGFLGLVFLAATGSIIYFKQLAEAHADRERYAVLRKIGVSRQEIRRAIAKQTQFIFALPLLVGIAHSAMILKVLDNVNLIAGSWSIAFAMIAYVIIYAVYYGITVASVNRIVNGAAA
ncbi:putative ABC transport system permease protein [Paenibacillus sp. CF384]|nr:putative ABC transport system permease protein [Paenibacillus sp. CF384]